MVQWIIVFATEYEAYFEQTQNVNLINVLFLRKSLSPYSLSKSAHALLNFLQILLSQITLGIYTSNCFALLFYAL